MSKEPVEKSDRIGTPLTLKHKIVYLILFYTGMICSYPTLFPIGMVITCILLFKKNNIKINLLGLFLVILQIINIAVFAALIIDMQGLF